MKRKKINCESCPIYLYLLRGNIYKLFSDLIADIIAIYIAGVNYLYEFVDSGYCMLAYDKHHIHPFINQVPFLIRTISCCCYFSELTHKYNLKKMIEEIIDDIYKTSEIYGTYCDYVDKCIINICMFWSKNIYEFDNKFDLIIFDDIKEDISYLVYKYNPFWSEFDPTKLFEENLEQILKIILPGNHLYELMSILTKRGKLKLFSMIIRDEFKISKSKEKEIINALLEGTPVPEEDPRHILHCYYEAYKQSEGEERPNYAATIYSLAFNTFKPKQKE